MVRTREYLTKFFSDESIDQEIDRIKRADVGAPIFSMESWEIDDFIVSILALADVPYIKMERNKIITYYKAASNSQ